MDEVQDVKDVKNEASVGGVGKRPMWQKIAVLLILGVIVVGGIYYFINSGQSQNTTNESVNTLDPVDKPNTGSMRDSTVDDPFIEDLPEELTVVGNDFLFIPAEVTVKQGVPLNLKFKNLGKFPHNLTINGLSVSTKNIQPGEEDTVIFTPNKTGSFTYVCTVGNHEEQGMIGTLKVE